MESTLQILNVIFLALFGTAGWRMLDEWRKSREERHQAELALREQQIEDCKTKIESLKVTHQHELEKRELQIARLSDENSRLSQKRDDRTVVLEEQIEFLKAQAPAGVTANFDALKRWYADQLSMHENRLEDCQSALSQEQLEHEATRKDKDMLIAQLQAAVETRKASVASDIGLRSILAPPDAHQRSNVERERQQVRNAAAAVKPSGCVLIEALKHWDPVVREIAAQGLVAQGVEVVPQLVARLERRTVVDYVLWFGLWFSGRYLAGHIQRVVAIIQVLVSIGDPAVPQLENLLLKNQVELQVRALIALRRINTEQANGALERHRHIVDRWRGIDLA